MNELFFEDGGLKVEDRSSILDLSFSTLGRNG